MDGRQGWRGQKRGGWLTESPSNGSGMDGRQGWRGQKRGGWLTGMARTKRGRWLAGSPSNR